MSAFALISGRLHGATSTRPTKSGGQVTFFSVKVANGSTCDFWSIATFSEEVRLELARLPEGAPISCSGVFHAELYEWKGAARLRLKLTSDNILPLKPTKARKGRPDKPPHAAGAGAAAESSWAHPGRSLDDDLPF